MVLRDGIELGPASFDFRFPSDPGEHVIVVRVPGHTDNETRIVLAVGQTEKVQLRVGPAVAEAVIPPVSTTDATATSASRGRTTGYVVLGIGAMGIAGSLAMGALALGAKSTVDEQCNYHPSKVCDSDSAYRAGSRGKTLATASTVAFAVGAVGIGVGTYLVLSHKGNKSTALAATARADGGFVGWVGQF